MTLCVPNTLGLELHSSVIHAASSGNFLPTFRDNLSVPFLTLKMGL
jgi:hypothetical protein